VFCEVRDEGAESGVRGHKKFGLEGSLLPMSTVDLCNAGLFIMFRVLGSVMVLVCMVGVSHFARLLDCVQILEKSGPVLERECMSKSGCVKAASSYMVICERDGDYRTILSVSAREDAAEYGKWPEAAASSTRPML
jgi:hypothetical protein